MLSIVNKYYYYVYLLEISCFMNFDEKFYHKNKYLGDHQFSLSIYIYINLFFALKIYNYHENTKNKSVDYYFI